MYKYNNKIEVKSKVTTISQLKKQKNKPKICRKFKHYDHHYITEIDGLKVAVFISKHGKNGIPNNNGYNIEIRKSNPDVCYSMVD